MAVIDLTRPDSFDSAYRKYRGVVFGAALDVLHDAPAAEDVVQDVFTALWLKPASYDPARASLRTYLTMVARSRAIDRHRSRSVRAAAHDRARSEAETTAFTTGSAADHVVAADSRRRVLSAVRELPAEQRDAMLLAYGRGLSAREIAESTRIPLGTAKSRVRLALANTRRMLGEPEAA
jgi:RNA polymerase sigma-70 factor (ECF subfamily)